ncbi:MAG: insulinase family protein [Cyclobacteriaceae bacterium]|nr:insulinase family protein [Cyclobacteriaceae bacterium]
MLDRTIAPAFVEPKKFKLPEPRCITFDQGARFFLLKTGDQPVVRLEIIFKAGSWFETQPGIAYFAGKMLSEGTDSFTSKDIAEKLDQYGAFVELQPGFDYINFSVHIPSRHFIKIIPVLQEMLFAPTFPEGEFELMKQIQTRQLSVQEQKNNYVASRLLRSGLYPQSPYGHVMDAESIQNSSVDQVRAHFDNWMGSFDIFLTGDFDEVVEQSIFNAFQYQKSKSHGFTGRERTEPPHFTKHIDKEASLQSSIFLGRRCTNRNTKGYGALLLLNEVFGGYFGSRLMQNIREDKGFTYGIHSHFVTLKNDAYFVVSTDVKKQHKEESLTEIQKEIDRLKSDLVGADELQEVKNYLKGSVLNTLTSPFALADKLKNIYFYDLGLDYYDRIFDEIDQTNSEHLKHLANEHLFDQPLSGVVVG